MFGGSKASLSQHKSLSNALNFSFIKSAENLQDCGLSPNEETSLGKGRDITSV